MLSLSHFRSGLLRYKYDPEFSPEEGLKKGQVMYVGKATKLRAEARSHLKRGKYYEGEIIQYFELITGASVQELNDAETRHAKKHNPPRNKCETQGQGRSARFVQCTGSPAKNQKRPTFDSEMDLLSQRMAGLSVKGQPASPSQRVYVTKQGAKGTKYHLKCGCSGARSGYTLQAVLNGEHGREGVEFTKCKVCWVD
ncbi:hypothetical protein KIPB_008279 [Kipferlia bialata]|uniref:GIY-YIG domain-containing protein n=1 Tax=Kipferlia bialata TaxID=797122 RepID=A0A9K3D2K3_9EUKA|nr:hypothetical protein KIPB_008279 [Kipferlia bialata]|eukprot:g8279.t1